MSNFRSIGQVAKYRPVSRCNMEELAAYQNTIEPSGGILFARGNARTEKDATRMLLLDLFEPEVWEGPLRILTMPGLTWQFERGLLRRREGNWVKEEPKRTSITSIECDRSIYYASIGQIPGLHVDNALTKIMRPPRFAEHAIRTRYVDGYYFANVDDLMRDTHEQWDAVWLDYTGPLSIERVKIITQFYERAVRGVLIVTALKARWPRETSAAIARAGGHSAWLRKHLPGQVLYDFDYRDTVPMTQFAVRKNSPAPDHGCRADKAKVALSDAEETIGKGEVMP